MAASSRREGEPVNVVYRIIVIGAIILVLAILLFVLWGNGALTVEVLLWWLRLGFFVIAFIFFVLMILAMVDREWSDVIKAAIVVVIAIVIGLIMNLLLMFF